MWHRFLGITEEIPIDRKLDTGTLDEHMQEAATLTTKAADQAADFSLSDKETVVLGSGDQEIVEARRLERGPLQRSKRRLSSDPCDVHQDQNVLHPARLTKGGVSSCCEGSGRRFIKRRKDKDSETEENGHPLSEQSYSVALLTSSEVL